MPKVGGKQPSIVDRLDYTLELIASKGMGIRAIYLVKRDRDELDKLMTKAWRGKAKPVTVYTSSFRDNLLVNDAGADKIEVPLRDSKGLRKSSTIYTNRGIGVTVKAPPVDARPEGVLS